MFLVFVLYKIEQSPIRLFLLCTGYIRLPGCPKVEIF